MMATKRVCCDVLSEGEGSSGQVRVEGWGGACTIEEGGGGGIQSYVEQPVCR